MTYNMVWDYVPSTYFSYKGPPITFSSAAPSDLQKGVRFLENERDDYRNKAAMVTTLAQENKALLDRQSQLEQRIHDLQGVRNLLVPGSGKTVESIQLTNLIVEMAQVKKEKKTIQENAEILRRDVQSKDATIKRLTANEENWRQALDEQIDAAYVLEDLKEENQDTIERLQRELLCANDQVKLRGETIKALRDKIAKFESVGTVYDAERKEDLAEDLAEGRRSRVSRNNVNEERLYLYRQVQERVGLAKGSEARDALNAMGSIIYHRRLHDVTAGTPG